MPVKMEGWGEADAFFDGLARKIEDERKIAPVVIEAAQPLVDRVKEIVGTGSPWPETKETRADIRAAIDKESAVGTVKVAIGATRAHAFKLNFQEFGTSKQPAYPSLRPAYDSTIGAVTAGVVAGLRSILQSLVR